ncbi:DUF771 domain-containing protein [Listeria sp. SHR_NRA_18]|uniref:DUF771 domain-containing protein n=1 Tax=Listeria TaxID=1637 RepID=UPI000F5EF84B|nr:MULTISPECIES: DUF771 domain-containing protein [Listeria]MBC1524467.1 DUF771 domain-containing protein [Listeria booriae]MBC6306445.1 DUF771 domain-containing protein [Listeria booriae]RQW65679.1 DUF771 domain-containing protein [Listeria sp. SHR_NRA_18]
MSLIKFDEETVKQLIKEKTQEVLEEMGVVGLIWRMDRMRVVCGGYSERWVVDHICHHPYVVQHQLAISTSSGWMFKAKQMEEFIDLYFPELGVNHKRGAKIG